MIVKKIKSYIGNNFQFFKKNKKIDLLIIDDFLPSTLSPWRSYEFDELVKAIPNSVVSSDLSVYYYYDKGKTYEKNLNELSNDYPCLASKCRKLRLFQNANVGLVYTLFYHNIIRYFSHFEKHKMPFAFTLYPGGGFVLGNQGIDNKLKLICSSLYFRGVIVNQPYVMTYLLENNIVDSSKIELISGVPLKIENYLNKDDNKLKFNHNSFEVLFMGNKYMAQGFDKGFDLFQMIAKQLIKEFQDIKFHIVGGFSDRDLNYNELKEFFIFHGQLNEGDFHTVLSRTQICISPNRINALSEGSFDGFPLASSVTAGLHNNILVLTDPLNQAKEIGLVEGEDFIKISTDVFDTHQVLKELFKDTDRMKLIAKNGQIKLKQLYSRENQIDPRLNFIKTILN
jgi:glycosyltransferase involved in cell wall biosynthesis